MIVIDAHRPCHATAADAYGQPVDVVYVQVARGSGRLYAIAFPISSWPRPFFNNDWRKFVLIGALFSAVQHTSALCYSSL